MASIWKIACSPVYSDLRSTLFWPMSSTRFASSKIGAALFCSSTGCWDILASPKCKKMPKKFYFVSRQKSWLSILISWESLHKFFQIFFSSLPKMSKIAQKILFRQQANFLSVKHHNTRTISRTFIFHLQALFGNELLGVIPCFISSTVWAQLS